MSTAALDASKTPHRATAAFGWLGATLLAERGRWPLWLPVLPGAGVAASFASPAEPPAWLGPAATAPLLAAVWPLRRAGPQRLVVVGLLAFAPGFSAAQLRTHRVATEVPEGHRNNDR